MRVSAKTEYACLAMLHLAADHEADEPARVRDIADAHGIPPRFLVQILLQLKIAGLVMSTRGASGGYQLARDPAEISLADVIAVIEGGEGESPRGGLRDTAVLAALRSTWAQIDAAEREMLEGVSLADLAARARGGVENMYYI
jgi:Rrf2 family protein